MKSYSQHHFSYGKSGCKKVICEQLSTFLLMEHTYLKQHVNLTLQKYVFVHCKLCKLCKYPSRHLPAKQRGTTSVKQRNW